MKTPHTSLLESKLKRHKISYTNKNGKITIGNSKMDFVILVGLVILPILAAIRIFAILNINEALLDTYGVRISLMGIFLFGGGLFYLSRMRTKKAANKNLKILEGNTIKIKNEHGEHHFNANTIKDFEYSLNQINESTYEGNLYLVDKTDRRHQLLGFDDNDSKYVLNDLKWFMEYFIEHTNMDRDKLGSGSAITLGFSQKD